MYERKSLPKASFPAVRLRRNRSDRWVRALVQENRLSTHDLIWPIFVREENCHETEISAMPGNKRLSPLEAVDAAKQARALGIQAIALFPYIDRGIRDPHCSEARNPDSLICRTVRLIKKTVPDIGIVCDVALDPYNSLGHDGLVEGGKILNDASLEILSLQALLQAEAGCDILAPSDMMDGRIAIIRESLEKSGFHDVKLCSYAAKYASAFYGPFREAVGSGDLLQGDKKTYQINPANAGEAMREIALDIDEGADMVIVKPGMPYLDIIQKAKQLYPVPIFAYQVSGEFAMIEAASANGWIDRKAAIEESLLAFKRAGADAIFTYFAPQLATWLREG